MSGPAPGLAGLGAALLVLVAARAARVAGRTGRARRWRGAMPPARERLAEPAWFRRSPVGRRLGADVGWAWRGVLSGAGAALAVAVVAGPVAGALALGAGAAGLVGAVGARRRRRLLQLERELPVLLDGVSASLRAGCSLRDAVAEGGRRCTGPLRDEVAGLVARVAAGEHLDDALERWAAPDRVAGAALVVAVLVLGHRTGGAHAAAVDGAAATLRERAAVAGELRALSSQARASAAVIVLAPLGFTIVTGLGDGGTWSFLLGSPLGLVCLVAGVALDLAGAAWMARLTGAWR